MYIPFTKLQSDMNKFIPYDAQTIKSKFILYFESTNNRELYRVLNSMIKIYDIIVGACKYHNRNNIGNSAVQSKNAVCAFMKHSRCFHST